MRPYLQLIVEGLLDLVYPTKCVVCEEFGPSYLCSSCLSSIEPVPEPYCPVCGHPVSGKQCQNCIGRKRSFSAARAAGTYEGALREAIHKFKYSGARMLAKPLAELMFEYLSGHADIPWRKADFIVPVPIHPARERQRGYNQSYLLAECLSKKTGKPLLADAIIRRRYTQPQVGLPGELRRTNVRGAFAVCGHSNFQGKTILLVDDVSTTCSTVHECSATMLQSGAASVYVICLAFGA